MQPMDYIGLDVHKQKISYCMKDGSGNICAEGRIPEVFRTFLFALSVPWDTWSAPAGTSAVEHSIFSRRTGPPNGDTVSGAGWIITLHL
jgi:hypothetical protein